jgi:DNA-binding transcriptional ArsR family regulator
MLRTVVLTGMVSRESTEPGLDAVAERVGQQATEAFRILGNETRLAILLALWDAQEPGGPVSEDEGMALSFSALRERLGRPDSGQFNYHLNKLVGPFVEQSEAGYTLTPPAEQILHTILAGTLTDAPSLDGELVDVGCYRCGAPTVVDYEDGALTWYCTSCEGAFQNPDSPPGNLGY